MGLTIVFAFYGEIFSGTFQPLLYILSIYAHPLVRALLGGAFLRKKGAIFSLSIIKLFNGNNKI